MVTGKPDPKKSASTRRSNVTNPSTNDENKTTNIESPKPTPADAPVETKSTDPKPAGTKPANSDLTEQVSEPKNHDDTDVEASLGRHTFDGKGENAVPESDFRAFSTEGVERGKLKSVEDVTQEVLNGNWGHTATTVSSRLSAAGYDVAAVEREYNDRVRRGAPKAF